VSPVRSICITAVELVRPLRENDIILYAAGGMSVGSPGCVSPGTALESITVPQPNLGTVHTASEYFSAFFYFTLQVKVIRVVYVDRMRLCSELRPPTGLVFTSQMTYEIEKVKCIK
jgi:hypothetical protein